MKKSLLFMVAAALVLILLVVTAGAKVLSATRIQVSGVHFFFRSGTPTQPQYVMTNFGPGNIRFLKAVDVVVNQEGDIEMVRIIYTPGDGFRREVFLRGIDGWVFKRPGKQAIHTEITVRVMTIEELFVR